MRYLAVTKFIEERVDETTYALVLECACGGFERTHPDRLSSVDWDAYLRRVVRWNWREFLLPKTRRVCCEPSVQTPCGKLHTRHCRAMYVRGGRREQQSYCFIESYGHGIELFHSRHVQVRVVVEIGRAHV